MRHAVRDSKGRFAKAQQALLAPEEKHTEGPLLRAFLQAAAVILLALIGACVLTTALLMVTLT